MSDAVLKAADRMREFMESADRGMARVPVAHISEWRKLLSERYQAEVERVNRATDAEIGGIHRSFAPSPAALPSPTSGAEVGGVEAVLEALRIESTDSSHSDAWQQGVRYAISEVQEALAKPASEPAGGGVRDEDIARWKRDSELLSAIQDECWDVRFTSSPNADAGDYNVNIEIVGHFMADPQERVVGENYDEDLRAALEQAMTAEPYPPARPVYDDPATLSSPASSSPAEEAQP